MRDMAAAGSDNWTVSAGWLMQASVFKVVLVPKGNGLPNDLDHGERSRVTPLPAGKGVWRDAMEADSFICQPISPPISYAADQDFGSNVRILEALVTSFPVKGSCGPVAPKPCTRLGRG